MRHAFSVRIGPVGFRIGSDWRAPIAALETLYRDYPGPRDGVADFTVRLFARRPWRRVVRPSVEIGGDYMLPEAAPLPMTGISGAGKSTLATLLAAKGWRFMGDEFALLDPATGLVHAFPRLISLKNEGIAAAEAAWPAARMGPLLRATPKGDIRHMVPDARAIAAMDTPAAPALLAFPRYGFATETRPVPPAEAFVRMTQASTNYVALGEAGFRGLTGLIAQVPSVAIDYPDGMSAVAQVEALWSAL